MAINLNNMSDIKILAINKMHLEDKINKLEKELSELKQQQLYKEDFNDLILCFNCNTLETYCYAKKDDKNNYHEYYRKVQFKNDDYSKYDKLPSKDVK